MGQLIYAGSSIGLSDAVLAHLDALMRHAFIDGKSFTFVIRGTTDDGVVGAQTLWFAPQIPIQIAYQDYETIQIARHTFSELYDSVTTNGVYFLGEGPLPYEFTDDGPSGSSDE